MFKTISEGKVKIIVPKEEKVSAKLPVFYNPIMKLNRDISMLLLNSVEDKDMQIALPLAGTGVRGIRFFKELRKGKIKNISFNDLNKKAIEIIEENLKKNDIKDNFKIHSEDANIFLLNSSGFDYIDIDPFGSPNPFLENSIVRLARDSILAVTATDTAPLAGTYPKTCLRKYWAIPKRDELMHETGLRILIRKVQLIGAQNDKALIPIYSYYKDHYFRIFFRCKKGKKEVDKIMKKHEMFNDSGPLWIGQLWDTKLAKKIYQNNKDEKIAGFLEKIHEESKIEKVGFFNIHKISKKNKINNISKTKDIIEKIKKQGYKVAITHFNDVGLRSDISEERMIEIFKKK